MGGNPWLTEAFVIEIDGSYGSGGGQVLRTAVGLAALTEKPCKVFNIRAKRRNPGLREQHLQAIRAVSRLCTGKLEGAKLGSHEIEFLPGKIKQGDVEIHISTAGSVGLVLQSLLIPASQCAVKIKISGGGTWGKWAPPVVYLQNILYGFLKEMGYNFEIKILREGFFPKGGAEVEIQTKPASWKPLELLKRGGVLSISGISVASLSLMEKKVAERQKEAASQILFGYCRVLPSIEVKYSPSLSIGSGIYIQLDTEHLLTVGGSAVGEPDKRAENVGREAVRNLIREYEGGGVDSHAADQLLPYLAIAGGKIKASQVTEHCRTNAFVIEKFLPVKFKIENNVIEVIK